MASQKEKQQKRYVKRIRQSQKNKFNRQCFSCTQRGPNTICINFWIFACDTCSGLHREFSHRVKGISMSDWSSKEVKMIETHGNEVAATLYLAKWNKDKYPKPQPSQKDKIRSFIRRAFVKKSWMDKNAARDSPPKTAPPAKKPEKNPRRARKTDSDGSASSISTQKLSDVVPGAKVTVQKKTAAKPSKASEKTGNFLDLDWDEEPAAAPKAAPAAADDDGWADDWSFGNAPGDTAFAAARGPAAAPAPAPAAFGNAGVAPAPSPFDDDSLVGGLAGLSMDSSVPEKTAPTAAAPAALEKSNPMGASSNSSISDAFSNLGSLYDQPPMPMPQQPNPYAQRNPYARPPMHQQYQQQYARAPHNPFAQPQQHPARPYAASAQYNQQFARPPYQQQQHHMQNQRRAYGSPHSPMSPAMQPAPRPAPAYGGGAYPSPFSYGGIPQQQQQQPQQFGNPFGSPHSVSPMSAQPPPNPQTKTPFDDF